MSVYESESKYPLTTDFIYRSCADRLKKRKLALNLTDTEIAADYDRKVINRIINNTKTRNNPYLIPPAYVKPLMEGLEFENDYQLFWGNENDEQFIELIFCKLVTDIWNEVYWNVEYLEAYCNAYWDGSYWDKSYLDGPYFRGRLKAEIIDNVLRDDVSYAKIYPVPISAFEYEYPPVSPFANVKNEEQVSLEEREQIRQKAILRLFKNTRPIEMFNVFFKEANSHGENRGFNKIDKRLDIFVDNCLMPFLKDNMPGQDSLGLRVYSIVATDMMDYVEFKFLGFTNSERATEGFDSRNTPEYDEILQSLMSAGKDYINKIETLQARLDVLYRREKFGC